MHVATCMSYRDGIHGYCWQAKTYRQIDLALTRRYERMGARFRQQPQNHSLLFEWYLRPPDESDISFHDEVTADIEIQDGLACLCLFAPEGFSSSSSREYTVPSSCASYCVPASQLHISLKTSTTAHFPRQRLAFFKSVSGRVTYHKVDLRADGHFSLSMLRRERLKISWSQHYSTDSVVARLFLILYYYTSAFSRWLRFHHC